MRRPQLDGLRFVLFLMVFATHYAPNPVKVGFLGYALPVFFVMSGFLITNVLLANQHPSLLARLATFYGRRVLRICPAYYLTVMVLIAMGVLTYPGHYLAYLLNLKLYALSLNPSPEFHQWFVEGWRRESMHLWSLSVEEQFYIIYPLILYLTPTRHRTTMLAALLVASIAARIALMSYAPRSFYGTLLPVCAEYFVWGCIFSWLQHRERLARLSPTWTFGLSMTAVVVLIGTEHYLGQSGFLQFSTSHYQTPIAAGMGFFIWGLWSLPGSHWVAKALSASPLVYFGAMSYTLYLVHLLTWDLLTNSPTVASAFGLSSPGQVWIASASLLISLFVAMAVWHLYEQPVYALRRYLPYRGEADPARPAVAESAASSGSPRARVYMK